MIVIFDIECYFLVIKFIIQFQEAEITEKYQRLHILLKFQANNRALAFVILELQSGEIQSWDLRFFQNEPNV